MYIDTRIWFKFHIALSEPNVACFTPAYMAPASISNYSSGFYAIVVHQWSMGANDKQTSRMYPGLILSDKNENVLLLTIY